MIWASRIGLVATRPKCSKLPDIWYAIRNAWGVFTISERRNYCNQCFSFEPNSDTILFLCKGSAINLISWETLRRHEKNIHPLGATVNAAMRELRSRTKKTTEHLRDYVGTWLSFSSFMRIYWGWRATGEQLLFLEASLELVYCIFL